MAPKAVLSAVLVVLSLTSCGSDDRRAPVAIVFESPYLAVLGEVDIWVEGRPERHSLTGANSFDCDTPALVTSEPDLKFTAVSERGFEWRGRLRLTDEPCQRIPIGTQHMHSSVLAYAIEEIPADGYCLPAEVRAGEDIDGKLARSFSLVNYFTGDMTQEDTLHHLFLLAERGDVYLRGERKGDSPFTVSLTSIPPARSSCETRLQTPGWWGPGEVLMFQERTEHTPWP